jgi:hypothetical protein
VVVLELPDTARQYIIIFPSTATFQTMIVPRDCRAPTIVEESAWPLAQDGIWFALGEHPDEDSNQRISRSREANPFGRLRGIG